MHMRNRRFSFEKLAQAETLAVDYDFHFSLLIVLFEILLDRLGGGIVGESPKTKEQRNHD
jgi:hypothetical protein